ncbi:PLDc N-terminal domain-containing protein [Nocardioides mesophilus]|uniref:PLDc N-terminal domain-containing protein n=1 Tax=Nocardioides mesophilus TaxID=433659 RepID=A0A7G9RCV4_9ACTN|nr:PLDc N-terminal domain-containing protein [Nocardioides mesophilus]QNN53429.1 PLDc N-terminal domain-containing protein [Nocardioides mesophilus]
MANKKWSDLSRSQKRVVLVVGALESVMTALALKDLAGRPADQVRGPKPVWGAALFVQPVGPVAYFAFGRR